VYKNTSLVLHSGLPAADELPWTISFVIRKRTQIDSFMELPKEKRPTDNTIWYGTPDDIEEWFEKVFSNKKNQDEFLIQINDEDVG